jgi:hypothetical protein
MKIAAASLVIAFLTPSAVMSSQKDWRRMERKKIVDQVRNMQKKAGLNEVAADPKGFKLYAVVKNNKITGWRAKGTRGNKLKLTMHEYPAGANESKEPGKYKMILVCVDDKEVCYEVEMVPVSEP